MNLQEFQAFFKEECSRNNLSFSDEKSKLLYHYMKLVLDWNSQINLTSITSDVTFVMKHYVDSLLIGDFVNQSKRVLDIGTGGGFPGIPLKIYYPDTEFTLIDSVSKKIMVLRDVIEKLELQKIEVLAIRAEELAKKSNYRESFDVVTARAVSKLATIAEYMLPFLEIGGKAICMKGPNIEQELQESQHAISVLGGKIEKIEKFCIDDEFERNVVVIKKVKSTDKKYPRGQGKPAKNPII